MNALFKKIKPNLVYFIAFLGGGLTPLAFAPYSLGVFAFVAPGLLLACLANRKPLQALLIGACFGIGLFGLGVNWVYVSIHDYGYTSAWLAIVITSLFVLLMALYPAGMAYLLNRYFPHNNALRALVIYPALWTAFEMLRGWLLTGFPWLFLGYAQMGNFLRALAPIGGVWLVSWTTVLLSSLVYLICLYYYQAQQNTPYRNRLFLGLIIIFIGIFGLNRLVWTQQSTLKLEVALIQGNIPQLMRWDPQHIKSIHETYESLTAQALKANIIVWPEGAIPTPLPHSTDYFHRMGDLAKDHEIALFSGVPSQLSDQQHYYNSIVGVGLGEGLYHKTHLVPFGEYVPFEKVLRGIIAFLDLPMSSFETGPADQAPLIAEGFSFAKNRQFRFAPLICYEIAYPVYVQQQAKAADFILTISNDTWFGTSIGPAQHLQIAQFRALETGKYVLRATNSGYTAIIEPNGDLQDIAPPFEMNVLFGSIYPTQGQTPWIRFGIWPLLTSLFVTLAAGYAYQKRRSFNKHKQK